MPICDKWIIIDSKDTVPEIIAEQSSVFGTIIKNSDIWEIITAQSNETR